MKKCYTATHTHPHRNYTPPTINIDLTPVRVEYNIQYQFLCANFWCWLQLITFKNYKKGNEQVQGSIQKKQMVMHEKTIRLGDIQFILYVKYIQRLNVDEEKRPCFYGTLVLHQSRKYVKHKERSLLYFIGGKLKSILASQWDSVIVGTK